MQQEDDDEDEGPAERYQETGSPEDSPMDVNIPRRLETPMPGEWFPGLELQQNILSAQLKGVATVCDPEEGKAEGVVAAQMVHIAAAESICTEPPPIDLGTNITGAAIQSTTMHAVNPAFIPARAFSAGAHIHGGGSAPSSAPPGGGALGGGAPGGGAPGGGGGAVPPAAGALGNGGGMKGQPPNIFTGD